jgi:hypothetical protein
VRGLCEPCSALHTEYGNVGAAASASSAPMSWSSTTADSNSRRMNGLLRESLTAQSSARLCGWPCGHRASTAHAHEQHRHRMSEAHGVKEPNTCETLRSTRVRLREGLWVEIKEWRAHMHTAG